MIWYFFGVYIINRTLHGRFSSIVEKYFTSECRNIFSTRDINTNEIPNHFTLIVFWCERRDILCSHSKGDIFTCKDNMLFSHVKISSFRAKAHLVFHWCLSNNIYLMDNKDRGKASSSTHTIGQKRERRELRWTNNYNCNNRPL